MPGDLTEAGLTEVAAVKVEVMLADLETESYELDVIAATAGPNNWGHVGYFTDAAVTLHLDQCGAVHLGY